LKFECKINAGKPSKEWYKTLSPGESISIKCDASLYFDLMKPGVYVIRASYLDSNCRDFEFPADGIPVLSSRIESSDFRFVVK